MEKKLRESIVPIYAVGAAWIIYALFFPLYRLIDFFAASAFSVAVYFAAKVIFPPKEVLVERKLMELTGDEKADAFIEEANGYLKAMRASRNSIKNAQVGAKQQRIEEITLKIFDYLRENPDSAQDIHRFTSYYLPTTAKLMDSYALLEAKGATTPNIKGTMDKIDAMLDKVITAFDKQLDSLYAYEAMDVSAEITVMQNILNSEGLLEDNSMDLAGAGVTAESAVKDFEKQAPSSGITLTLEEKE
ncbi:MAG: hypothetical protein GX061_07390 [Eubacteriaceae bacterium]|nr:hypothetical protein [Eubacteriaceae bacterium]